MIRITSKGDFRNIYKFLNFVKGNHQFDNINKYAQKGVDALQSVTPIDTGKTAASWGYEINSDSEKFTITWTNDNKDKAGTPIVLLLHYGHGTPSGRYIQGRDFINPALKPIFDEILENVWKEVVNA